MSTTTRRRGDLEVHPLAHPQGCRGYLVVDREAREALALDVHLDLVRPLGQEIGEQGLALRWVVDSHTHADHPSGSGALAAALRATRVAHRRARHVGVTHLPDDGETLALGDRMVTVRHAPGHTPDHMVLTCDGAVFSGDSLFIGGVARADFLGGDAGTLFDTLHDVILKLPDETALYPGHDYEGRTASTLAAERASNPWLAIKDRDRFIASLTASAPQEPANMAALLRFNLEGTPIPPSISAQDAAAVVQAGGAASVIDVRTPEEVEAAHIPGSRHIELEQILERAAEIQATPAPRLILCRIGRRAEHARQVLTARLGIEGMSVIAGGILAYAKAGGQVAGGRLDAPAAGGGCCAAPPPTA